MNILFATLVKIDSLDISGIYQDLLRYFHQQGHNIFIISPSERRFKKNTFVTVSNRLKIISVWTLNIQKTNFIEKCIGTILLEKQFHLAAKRYLNEKIDVILYSTPPITLYGVIKYIKKRDNTKTYLLLKDIFPQNAVDIGSLSKINPIYYFFRNKEKKMYHISDYIGCMSPANIEYILSHNKFLFKGKVEVCPNSIEVKQKEYIADMKSVFRRKYNIPEKSIVFIYGGNLGKLQGLNFLLTILERNKNLPDRYFFIVGSGTEYHKINSWLKKKKLSNVILLENLPKDKYEELITIADVGLIFLDPRFTIPNYPSRLLSYMENKMPVLFAVDKNTDIGTIAVREGYGFSCLNGETETFNKYINLFISKPEIINRMGMCGYNFLNENYSVKKSYEIIMKHFS